MTTIDRTAQLVTLIRTQLIDSHCARQQAATAQRAAQLTTAATSPAAKSTPANQEHAVTGSATGKPLEEFILQRVRMLAVDDPQRRRKAFWLFMASVLLQEFGENLIDDPGFQKLIDQVLLQMESDPKLRFSMQHAADMLLAQSGDLSIPA